MTSWKKLSCIWAGELFSSLSSSIVQFAIIWWIAKETNSPLILTISFTVTYLPQAILSPFIGVWVDRLNKKWILIISDLLVALLSAILGILFYFDNIDIWQIYVLLGLRALCNSFYTPALQSVIPLIAPKKQLLRVTSINQGILTFTEMAGPVLGALFLSILDMPTLVFLDVIGAIFASCLLLCIKIPSIKKVFKKSMFLYELREGMKALQENKIITSLILTSAALSLVLIPISVILPLVIVNHFQGDAMEMGITEFIFGLGMLLGSLILVVKKKLVIDKGIFISLAIVCIGILLTFCAFIPSSLFVTFLIVLGTLGIFIPFQNNPLITLIQESFDVNILGRIFSLMNALRILPVISLIFVGWSTNKIGIMNMFLAGGLFIIIAGCGCWLLIYKSKK